ncbi:MAG: hypothetical protein MK102_00665 [Fuerstiella sp.]|nr:hypothetical protein [Fuerstiella sp.]
MSSVNGMPKPPGKLLPSVYLATNGPVTNGDNGLRQLLLTRAWTLPVKTTDWQFDSDPLCCQA